MEPYFRLEEHELGVRLSSQRSFQQAIVLWMKQIDLLTRGMAGTYELDGLSREGRHSLSFRLNLLGLSVSTTKLALDGVLAGHYNGSLALVRNLLETWRRVAYSRIHPSDVWRWFPKELWPIDVLSMPDKPPSAKEIGVLIEREGDELDQQILKHVEVGFDKLNSHVHPTLEGATQTWGGSVETSVFSPQFSELHAGWCFLWGLLANRILINEVAYLRFQGDDWMSERSDAAREFEALRPTLRIPAVDEVDPEHIESDKSG